jgi:LysR family transcriptional regulator, nitrogen assimilation regulatory protein
MGGSDMIDLQHLRVFVRIAELGSFTKGATALGVTQPNVSHVIKEIEKAWDGELFYRTGRGVTLSEFGQLALLRAKALLGESDRVSNELRAFGKLPSGDVSFGLPPSLVPVVLPALLKELREELPGIRLSVHEAFSDQIERWLSAGEVEVGICNRYSKGNSTVRDSLFASPLVLAAASSAPRAPAEVPFRSLPKYPLVLSAGSNSILGLVLGIARSMQLSLNILMHADTIHAQKHICEIWGCYTVKGAELSSLTGEEGFFQTSLIVDPPLYRHALLITSQQRPLSRAAREVARRVTKILKALPGR